MCILLVEDEAVIRDILVDELDFQGFDVCEAPTGDHAATLIESPPKRFSILVTDIHMPGQRDGLEVARLMRRHHPGLPIIYTTGRPDILDGVGPLGPKDAVLVKPYTPTSLIRTIRRLLADA